MGTLEQELQRIHDAGIGVSITWLSGRRVDLRLVHKNGAVAAEGNVKGVANVCRGWSGAAKPTPKAYYEYAASLAAGNSGKLDKSDARENWKASASGRITPRLIEIPCRMAARKEP
jgi:hypothetical protein